MREVGQSSALRAAFADAYAAVRPRRLLILGCTTGHDLDAVDPAVTETVVGVDLNPAYLALARPRAARLGRRVELVEGDLRTVRLPSAAFDLVHAALVFEYVEPAALFRRIAGWMAPGGACSVVTQNPTAGAAPVSRTPYTSLLALDGRLHLRGRDDVVADASGAGLRCASAREVALPLGKSFSVCEFRAWGDAARTPA